MFYKLGVSIVKQYCLCHFIQNLYFFQRSSLCDLPTGNITTGIVQDTIALDTVCFKIAPIGDCRVINLTEQEEIRNGVSREVITGPVQVNMNCYSEGIL